MKPLDRSAIIRQSIWVFIDGLAGFLPLIGIIPATTAIVRGIRIRRAYAGPNPADHYRKWGMALGCLCILLNLCAVLIAITNLIAVANRGYWVPSE